MYLLGRIAVIVVVALFFTGVRVEAISGEREQSSVAHARVDKPAVDGLITGVVVDVSGEPLEKAMVSAFGPSGVRLVVSDSQGRFALSSLEPGRYLIQAHLPGYANRKQGSVLVAAGGRSVHAIAMARVRLFHSPEAASVNFGFSSRSETEQFEEEDRDQNLQTAEESTPHAHDEKAWRLRRARRSVFKQTEVSLVSPKAVTKSALKSRANKVGLPGSLASFLAANPLGGELNLLTRGTLPSANRFIGDVLQTGIANLSVSSPIWQGEWTGHGAVTTGDVMSWLASGEYLADPGGKHRVGFDVTYGRQRYGGANPAALTVGAQTRHATSFAASDSWVASPHLKFDYGGRYSTYGYIEEDGLFSPAAAVTMTPSPGYRIRLAGAQETIAPGAEEFLPPADTGLWLPPERTFGALSHQEGLYPETTRHFEVGIEHDLSSQYAIGVRRFYQGVRNQIATLFGVGDLASEATGHYYLARAGSVVSRGWIFTLSRHLGNRLNGSVDYAVAEAEWVQAGEAGFLNDESIGGLRPAFEQIHDLSGALEAEFSETGTKVFVRCRVNGAFAYADSDNSTGLDARFDILVHQALPFSPFAGSRWEVLMAVRSLFFDPNEMASMFNELLVVRSPKQVVGGVVVHF